MASKEQIEMDFRQALKQADRVDEIAEQLARVSKQRFAETLQELSVNWKGENANKYLKKGNKLQNKMNESAESLRSVADDIRSAAKKIYDAEMAALAIAQKRDY